MKKVKIITIISLLCASFVHSQSSSTSVSDNNAITLRNITGNGTGAGNSYGLAMRFVNPTRTVEGSIYLFNDWNNYAVIQAKENKSFSLKNINLNLRRNRFVSKIGKDSIFIFDMSNIENINIYGKIFKKIKTETGSRIFEVIFESEKISILNFHSVKLVEGSVNPMLSRKTDKFVHKETFFLMGRDGLLDEFKFRKKDITDLLLDNQKARAALADFYKVNKLSYKSIEDFKKAFSTITDLL